LKHWTVVDGPEAVAQSAADAVVSLLREALAAGGDGVLAVSATAAVLLTLAQLVARWGSEIPRDRVRVLLADDRALPPGDPASRYGLLYRSFLLPAGVPPGHSVRFWSEGDPPEAVVGWFETSAREFLGTPAGEDPRIDVALLGLEPPGVLGPFARTFEPVRSSGGFAGSVLTEQGRVYALTPEAVARAGRVVAVAAGGGPAAPLEAARSASEAAGARVDWFVDREMDPA
jgi:6-phosphogluconolactonase/glucosamine-6-phosphate isomerase/deaminase